MSNEEKFFRILNETREPAYDVETNGLDWKTRYICGYSISDGKDAVYIPVRHEAGGNISKVNEFEGELSKSIKSHQGKIVGHNVKFDAHFSQNHGIDLGNKVVDTMSMACLLDENRRSFSLSNVCKSYDIAQKKEKDLYDHIGSRFRVKPDRTSMAHFHRLAGNDPLAVEYAAGDTLSTSQLWEIQKKDLYREELDIVRDLENELTYVLQKMERRGIGVDPETSIEVKEQIRKMLLEAESKLPLDDLGFFPINVNSKNDLKQYFEICEVDDWPLTAPSIRFPAGQPSFTQNYLSTFEEGINILNVRKLTHLKNSFLDVLDEHIFNDRIHTTFNQTRGETHGTKGGRLSSSNPNKQQVPKRDEVLGRIYRRMFRARKGYKFVEFDYSQAEPRLYTHYSNEPALLKGYTSDPVIDMHSVVAEYMSIPRKQAKSINLGMMYTMGVKKLAAQLGISYDEALFLFKKYHKTFPNISWFTKQAEQRAIDRNYVFTILKRRRRFPDPRFAYRAANAIIQGGSADIMKWKLVEIDRYLVDNNLEEVCLMLLTIHDSVIFEIHEDYMYLTDKIKEILCRVQVPPFNFKVPFTVDMGVGDDWSEATYGKAA